MTISMMSLCLIVTIVFSVGFFVGRIKFDIPKEEVKLIAHDPEDLKDGPSATIWKANTYCPICAKEPTYDEKMTDICLGCGSHTKLFEADFRSYRQIFNGEKWIYQIRYKFETVFCDNLFSKESLPKQRQVIPPHAFGKETPHL
jgi:hypothetical protein